MTAQPYPQVDIEARLRANRADERAKLAKVAAALADLLAVHDTCGNPFSKRFDRAELAFFDALSDIGGIEDAAFEQAEIIRDELREPTAEEMATDLRIREALEARAA